MSDWWQNEMVVPRRPCSANSRLWLVIVLLAVALLWTNRRELFGGVPRYDAQPRAVVPREKLVSNEQATIDLFERCSKSVVYVSPRARAAARTVFGYRDVWQEGTGSGIIWDDRGYVVTNYHVIQGAEQCLVTLPDNTTYPASYVGALPAKDVAVLHIDAPRGSLQPVDVGTSKDLKVGQSVFAIGNPFGLDFTLTTGVVSALNREIESPNDRTIQGVIQTDAAINPGNSGGPLLDSAGRLIGMNTAIVSKTGSSAGIGFAVPVDTINRVVPQLIAHGKVIRPGLGINPADDAINRRFDPQGVLILNVSEGSAAEEAGLRPTYESRDGRIVLGDLILKINDTPTPNVDSLLNTLEKHAIGETVQVRILRGESKMTVPVTLQALK